MSWLPAGYGFISSTIDGDIFVWSLDGDIIEKWGSDFTIQDFVITPDASRLFLLGQPSWRNKTLQHVSDNHFIFAYTLATKEQQIIMHLDFSGDAATSLLLSRDTRSLLVNCFAHQFTDRPTEVLLIDTLTREVLQRFRGPTQTYIILRSCFVGASEQFVASGSEDGNVYVWDRSSGTLVKTLSGHGTEEVGVVASNPANRNNFASASYDSTVRLWELK